MSNTISLVLQLKNLECVEEKHKYKLDEQYILNSYIIALRSNNLMKYGAV